MTAARKCPAGSAGSRRNAARWGGWRGSRPAPPVAPLEAAEPPAHRGRRPGGEEERDDRVADQLEVAAEEAYRPTGPPGPATRRSSPARYTVATKTAMMTVMPVV